MNTGARWVHTGLRLLQAPQAHQPCVVAMPTPARACRACGPAQPAGRRRTSKSGARAKARSAAVMRMPAVRPQMRYCSRPYRYRQ